MQQELLAQTQWGVVLCCAVLCCAVLSAGVVQWGLCCAERRGGAVGVVLC